MNTESVPPIHWTRLRWGTAIGLALMIQAGLVFLLAARVPVTSRQAPRTLCFRQVPDREVARLLTELPVSEPTLFALPGPFGFSGMAWLKMRPLHHSLYEWNEPPLWLGLRAEQLGKGFLQFVRTNGPAPLEVADKPPPEVSGLAPSTLPTVLAQSILRVEGELAKRPLLSVPALPDWPPTEILSNTVVQVVVNAAGYPLSATVLLPGSGLKAADQRALELTRELQFKPLDKRGPESSLNTGKTTIGRLVFEWRTSPAATNALPAAPNPGHAR